MLFLKHMVLYLHCIFKVDIARQKNDTSKLEALVPDLQQVDFVD
jgi:hypothetical protein